MNIPVIEIRGRMKKGPILTQIEKRVDFIGISISLMEKSGDGQNTIIIDPFWISRSDATLPHDATKFYGSASLKSN